MRVRGLWVWLILVAVAAPGAYGDRKFVASETNAAIKEPGRILITNDGRSLVAWRFHGGIRTALVRIQATKGTIPMHPYGAVIYESGAAVPDFVPEEIARAIREAASREGVDPRLVAAMAARESRFEPNAVSKAGARGIMQLMPETAKILGVQNIFDVRENVGAGVRYIRMLLNAFRGDLGLALAAYNAGPGAVEQYRGVPPYRETIAYVAAVTRHYESIIR